MSRNSKLSFQALCAVLAKYLILALVSFTIIMITYELLVKRFNPMRFLFDLKPKWPAPVTSIPHLQEKTV